MFLTTGKWISHSVLIGVLIVTAFVGSFVLIPAAHAAPVVVSPTDANIKYIGRWDSSSSTVHTSYWPGAYFKTDFTGTTAKIELTISANIYVSIDHGTDKFFANANGTVNLTPTPLAAGTHTLRVAAYSEHDDIHFQGLILDAGAKTAAPVVSPKLIEFVGDSITAGATDSKHALSDYAWLVGEQLGVEHTQIAQGGICLVDGVQCGSPNALGMSRQFFKLQTVYHLNSPNWDFTRYQANAVVINLGTNDAGYHISDATFQASYVTFLHNIRAKYPSAPIFVLRTFKGRKAIPTLAAVRAVNAAGDRNVHYIDTTGWLSAADYTDGTHPTDAGQLKVASRLSPIIAPFL